MCFNGMRLDIVKKKHLCCRINNRQGRLVIFCAESAPYYVSVDLKQQRTMKIRIKHFYVALALLAVSFGMPSCDSDNDDASVTVPSTSQAVDLGLPSGTLWAPWNVGATKPGEPGAYFAWGETTAGKTKNGEPNYDWDNYKWTDDGGETFTKYTISGKTTLDAEDDASTANWGGKWRVPTKDQFDELREYCSYEWKEEGEYARGSLAGYLLTSKRNGRKLFFPAAGYCREAFGLEYGGDGYYREVSGLRSVGIYGEYWCAELYSYYSYANTSAWNLGFYPGEWHISTMERCYGFSVRPVSISAE